MTKRGKKKRILFLILFLTSCIDLQHVNTFCSTAVTILQSYADIHYSFSSSYIDYSAGKKLLSFDPVAFNSNRFTVHDLVIDTALVSLNKKADETISYFINTLTAYFEGLSEISAKETVHIKFDGLASNLKSSGNVKSKLGISDQQIDAGANIAGTFANEILGKYREKKLRYILIEKDSDLSNVTEGLVHSLQILNDNIGSDAGLIQLSYNIVFANPKIEATRKMIWQKDYLSDMEDLRKESEKIRLLIEGVRTIREGHKKIVDEVKKSARLNKDEIAGILDQYSSEVFDIQQQIKLLTK